MPFPFPFRKPSIRALNISAPLSRSEMEQLLVDPLDVAQCSSVTMGVLQLPVDESLPNLKVSSEFRTEAIDALEHLMSASATTLVSPTPTLVERDESDADSRLTRRHHVDDEKRYGMVFDDDDNDHGDNQHPQEAGHPGEDDGDSICLYPSDSQLSAGRVQFEEPVVEREALRVRRPTRVMKPIALHTTMDVPLASPHLVVRDTACTPQMQGRVRRAFTRVQRTLSSSVKPKRRSAPLV